MGAAARGLRRERARARPRRRALRRRRSRQAAGGDAVEDARRARGRDGGRRGRDRAPARPRRPSSARRSGMQALAASAPVALRARVAALPGWAWVGALVVVSTLVRAALARRVVAPWIFSGRALLLRAREELRGDRALRDPRRGDLGVRLRLPAADRAGVRALRLDPARLRRGRRGSTPALMSLSAVPVYLLARRVVSVRGALVAVALTLVLPAFAYTATIMTENAFMPLFCADRARARAGARAADARPAGARPRSCSSLDFLTRAQAVAFLPAVVVAPLLYAAFAGRAAQLRRYVPLGARPRRRWPFWPSLAEVVRGRSPLALLGAYAVTGHTHYPPLRRSRAGSSTTSRSSTWASRSCRSSRSCCSSRGRPPARPAAAGVPRRDGLASVPSCCSRSRRSR